MELRKLDALVAEHVFGESVTETDECNGEDNLWLEGENEYGIQSELPFYSTNIAAAWEVVNKLGLDKWRWTGEMGKIDDSECNHWSFRVGDQHFGANAKSTPLAICLAALKSKNIDVSEWENR